MLALLRRYLPVATVLILGGLLSTGGFYVSRTLERAEARRSFESAALSRISVIQTMLQDNLDAISTVSTLFTNSSQPGRETFLALSRFQLSSLDLRLLAWAPEIPARQRKALFTAEYPEQSIAESVAENEEELVFPLYYLAPREGHEALLGLELNRDPELLESLLENMKSGQTLLFTRAMRLHEQLGEQGVLVLVPVRRGEIQVNQHQPFIQPRPAGVVLGVFRVGEVVSHALRRIRELEPSVMEWPMDLWIEDASGFPEPTLLHAEYTTNGTASSIYPGLKLEKSFMVGGHTWLIRCRPSLPELAEGRRWVPHAALWTGLLLTLMIVLYSVHNIHHTGRLRHEIEQRKRIEKALRESEARFLDMVFNTSDWIWELDHNFRLVYTSEKLMDVLGYDPEEVQNLMPLDLMAEDEAMCYEARLAPLLAKREPFSDLEHWLVHQDGHEVCVRSSGVPIFDNNHRLLGYRGVSKDITGRKQAESYLRDTHMHLTQFKATLDISLDGIFMFEADPEPLFCYVNRGGIEQSGYGEGELLQMSPVNLKPAFTPARFKKMLQSLRDGEQAAITYETIHQRRDGRFIPVEIFLQYIQLPDHPGKFVEYVRDISQRLSKQRLQYAKEAAEQARQAAELASCAKSLFLAQMSHEFRTPLNGILGCAQLLLQDSNLTEKQRRATLVVLHSGEHLLGLLNDILDLSKIEAGNMELQPDRFELRHFFDDIADFFRIRTEQKNLNFDYSLGEKLPRWIYADARRLRQVLLNLLGNALKFTERGSISLHVGLENNCLFMNIRDTGPGISQDELEKIFHPFQQASAARNQIEGTGLGLSISKRLVELMGGRLRVESQPDIGSLFRVELTLSEAGEEQETTQTVMEDASLLSVQSAAATAVLIPKRSLPPTPPDRQALNNLLNLAMMGDIQGILEYLPEVEEKQPKAHAFLQRLKQLAERFEERKICELLRNYVEGG